MTTDDGARPFVTGIVLAAGASTRMGSDGPKQLAQLSGRPLLQHALDAAAAARVDEVIVVLGARLAEIRAALTLPPKTRVVENPEYAAGQRTSLQCGLAAASPEAAFAVVLLGDEPTLTSEWIDRVVDRCLAAGATLARPIYPDAGGRPGHPVVLARERWSEIARLNGDEGARSLFAAGGAGILEIPTPGSAPPDIDTEADLVRVAAAQRETRPTRNS